MLKMVDGTGIIGVDMVCPLGGAVSPPQPPNFDKIEMEGVGSLTLPNSLKAPLERLELIGNSVQGENPAPDNPQEIKSAGRFDEASGKYLLDVKVNGKNLFNLTDNYIWGYSAQYQHQITVYSLNAVVYMPCKPNTTYTIYGRTNVNGNNNVKNRVATANDFPAGGTKLYNITETQLSNPVTITTDELSKYLVIMAVTDNECNIDTREQVLKQNVSKMMVIIGNAPTPYEPYTEQTLTLTSDRPLTKWDKLVEQDGQYGWLYGSGIKTFESDVFKLYGDNDKAIQYQVPFEEITNSWDKSVCYCNTFENVIGQTIYTQSGKTDFYMGCVHKSMVFSAKNKQGIFASIETFQEWIRNSGTYVWYKTDNKKFVPLSQEEQTQLRNLHSYNGTTHITVDSGEVPCGIKLTYRKEI